MDALTERLEAASDMANLIDGLSRFFGKPTSWEDGALVELGARIGELARVADDYWTATEKDGMA